MVRFALMIVVFLANLLAPAAAAAQSSCQDNSWCLPTESCITGACVPRPCNSHADCRVGACIAGQCTVLPCKALDPQCWDKKPSGGGGKSWKQIKRERDERTREIVREELGKLPPPPAPVVPEPIKGEDGKPCTVKQGTDGVVIDCPDGSRGVVTNGKNATEADFDIWRPFGGVGFEQMGPNSLMKSFGGVSAAWDGLLLLGSLGYITDFGYAGIGQRSTGLSVEVGLGWEDKWFELALMGYWWISAREELREWDLQGAGAKVRAEFFPLAGTIVPKILGVYVDAGVGVTFTRGTPLENAPTQGAFGIGLTLGHQF